MKLLSSRPARRCLAVLTAGLLLGVAPSIVTSAAVASALPQARMTATSSDNNVGSSGSTKIYDPTSTITFTVTVAPDKTGQDVTLVIQRLVSGTFYELTEATAALESGSTHSFAANPVAWHPGGTYRAQWTYAGDSVNAPSASNYINFAMTGTQTDLKQVKIKYTLTTPSNTNPARAGFYTVGTTVSTKMVVSPNKSGSTVNFYAEQFVNGKWVAITVTPSSRKLTTASVAVFKFKQPAGTYRVRTSASADAFTLGASSPWVPVTFQ